MVLDQINKLKPTEDDFYWVFPKMMVTRQEYPEIEALEWPVTVKRLVAEMPDPAEFMIGFFAQQPKAKLKRVKSSTKAASKHNQSINALPKAPKMLPQ